MRRPISLLFKTALCLIALLSIAFLALKALPIEFVSQNEETLFEAFIFLGLPVAILLTLTMTVKKKDKIIVIISKIVLTLFASFIPLFFAGVTALDGLCKWVTEEILFVKKGSAATKIALRSFGCGAVDGTPPNYKTFKITYYTSHIIWVSEIDTTEIDRNQWLRVSNTKDD